MVAVNHYLQGLHIDENLFCLLLNSRDTVCTMASIAAAQGYDTNGSNLSCPRHPNAKMTPRQVSPSLSPRLRPYGGASHASCRFFARKIRNLVVRPVLAAAHPGDKLANFAIDHHLTQLTIFAERCLRR